MFLAVLIVEGEKGRVGGKRETKGRRARSMGFDRWASKARKLTKKNEKSKGTIFVYFLSTLSLSQLSLSQLSLPSPAHSSFTNATTASASFRGCSR